VGSDRARVSYDSSRHWRGVVNQQGRVTLEADWNEAAALAAEEDRAQLVDVIGPAGTPDDGYRVLPVSGSGDLTIQHGTMYVGGERMVLEADLDYAQQPDWVDRDSDQLWVAPSIPEGGAEEAVYLLLREQEVGAVEDPALLDIALGGPDTSERLRIVQRVVGQGAVDRLELLGPQLRALGCELCAFEVEMAVQHTAAALGDLVALPERRLEESPVRREGVGERPALFVDRDQFGEQLDPLGHARRVVRQCEAGLHRVGSRSMVSAHAMDAARQHAVHDLEVGRSGDATHGPDLTDRLLGLVVAPARDEGTRLHEPRDREGTEVVVEGVGDLEALAGAHERFRCRGRGGSGAQAHALGLGHGELSERPERER